MDKKLCMQCDKPSSTGTSISCGYCSTDLHFECLRSYGVTSIVWNGTNPSKYGLSLFNSSYIKFVCKNCKHLCNNYVINDNNSASVNSEKIIVELNSLKSQFNLLSDKISELTTNLPSVDLLSNAISSLPDTIIKSTNKSFSDIVKSSLPKSSSSSMPHVSSPSSLINQSSNSTSFIVIEHIKPVNRNISYIKSLFNYLNIDPNSITNFSFRSHFANITLSSPCISDSLINSNSKLISSNYESLYIRPYIDASLLKLKRIYFHASKSSLTDLRCVFNKSSSTYQLRPIIQSSESSTSRIDWKCKPFIPDEKLLSIWSNSFDEYCKGLQSNISDNSDNNSDNSDNSDNSNNANL